MHHKIAHYLQHLVAGFSWLQSYLRRNGMKVAERAEKIYYKGPRSLANRILLLQFVWAVVAYIFVIAAMWYAASSVIESSLRNQAEGWVVKLDEMGIPFYVSRSRSKLKEGINNLHNFPEVIGVRYLDANGKKVIAEYSRRGENRIEFKKIDTEIKENFAAQSEQPGRHMVFEKGGDDRIRIVAPLMVKSITSDGLLNFSLESSSREKNELIGYISIVLDYSFATRQLHDRLRDATGIIAVLMVLAAVIGRVLIRWALRPLSRLEEPLSRLANGETDVIVESTGDHEIVQIGRALNTTIGALRERDEALRRMANHDALTGLCNRKHFSELLEKEIRRIDEVGGASALFFFDLDRFKHINDTYGHAAGDRLLIQVSDVLRKRLREDDVLARFGGDEFVALVRNINHKRAQEIGAELVNKMQGFAFYEGVDAIKIQFSVGITLITDGRATPHHYLKQADMAVHEAKSQGRNRYFMYDAEISSKGDDYDSGWYDRLKAALQQEKFRFHYQPLIGLKEQQSYLHEVLVRLPDSRHGLIIPGGFFPAMERFGLMPEMDRFVVRKVIQILEDVKDEQYILSVNCSEHIFDDYEFTALIGELLVEHSVKPHQLVIEVSEQTAVRNLERVKPVVQGLAAMGVSFAIDDFGAGFASFSYIKQFPVNCLKIHGSLIERIALDSVDRITVSSIVSLAQELGIETVAKFVPNEETLSLLREMGVDYAQGDYLGEPNPDFGRERPRLSVVK